jgi:hypothetical protein
VVAYAAVKDADESVGESSEGLVVGGAGAVPVVAGAGTRELVRAEKAWW